MSIQEGLTINVYIDGQRARPTQMPTKSPEKPQETTKSDDLCLRMMVKDDLNEDDHSTLINDIVLYARDLLQNKKLGELKQFLRDSKDSMPQEAKDIVAEEIRLGV